MQSPQERDTRDEPLFRHILEFLSREGYQPKRVKSLARAMGVAEHEYGDFRSAVKALTRSGRIVLGAGNAVLLPQGDGDFVGRFRANPKGFGFIIPETSTSHGDLFVPPGKSMGALTGDLVRARVRKSRRQGAGSMYEGQITQIIERGRSQFVGELQRAGRDWFVRSDGNIMHAPIYIHDAQAKGAKVGQQVVVDITRFPTEHTDALGVITKILGTSGKPEVDTQSMIIQHQLPDEFPEEALDWARKVVSNFNAEEVAATREDSRDLFIVTIDPDDARDYDDAISITELKKGLVELGVHIADVSHFVVEGSPLDREARERATSTYFPKHVIPMLPEVLSNGLCSLQEKQPRLVKSAFMTYNARGEVVRVRFANSLIQSAKRLTYAQATRIIEGKPGRFAKATIDLVKRMETLARAIEERRRRGGMLELDLPDVDLVFDDENHVVGVVPADTSYSHKIIEMFMVEANEAVARLFADLGVPHMRRIHPDPETKDSESLNVFLNALGLKPVALNDRIGLQALIRRAKGTPASYAVNLAVLRSMSRAHYSPQLSGHFALASSHYAHFTSPIRRYPDLTVHRLLDRYLNGRLDGSDLSAVPSMEALEELGAYCSERERRSEEAERELRLVKILRLISDRVGEEMPGVVTGVTNFGVFVQLREFLIEGLLRFEDIADDWWEVDTSRGCVIGQRTGQRIMIGQQLAVIIDTIDIPTRRMDLALPRVPGQENASAKRSRSRKPSARKTAARTDGKKRKAPSRRKTSRRNRSKGR